MKYFLSIGFVTAIIGIGFIGCEDPEVTNPNDPNYELSAPTDLTAEPISDSSISLTWKDNEKYELGFVIERDSGVGFVEIGTVGSDVTGYTDSGLTYRERYEYRVGAYTASNTSAYSKTAVTIACMSCVVDYDGNIYETIQIGTQVWLAENLMVTHYRDGTEIATVTDWSHTSTGAYIVYDNVVDNKYIYGLLYNWYAASDSRNIAPEGWHVPSDAEWKELEVAVGMSQSEGDDTGYRGTNEGSKLAGNAALWNGGILTNHVGFDSSGFMALPAGYYQYIYDDFTDIGNYAYFWSTSQINDYHAWCRSLSFTNSKVKRDVDNHAYGFSIRCIKN
jgi:uncharacterized protein (TIGR02145 family)